MDSDRLDDRGEGSDLIYTGAKFGCDNFRAMNFKARKAQRVLTVYHQ
jgi:hypothetical protein